MAERTGKCPPWAEFVRKCEKLFELDPDVTVGYDEEGHVVTLYVRGDDKAESLSEVMPCEVTFGAVSLAVEVKPSNEGELTPSEHLRRAFAGNPVLLDVTDCDVVPGLSMPFALFAPEAVQYECDNAGSPYGVRTCTYETLAKEVLAFDGVFLASELLD